MIVEKSYKSLLTTGYLWVVRAGPGKRFYDTIQDPMDDCRYDEFPLKPEIIEWFKCLPAKSWRVDPEQSPYQHRNPSNTWDRPIRFRHISHVTLFKLRWA